MLKAQSKKQAKTAIITPDVATASDIGNLHRMLQTAKNAGISVNSFMNYLTFKEAVDKISQKRNTDLKTCMEGYNITHRVYRAMLDAWEWDYEKHPKRDEIAAKVSAINSQAVTLPVSNFMEVAEFCKFTEGMPMENVMFIKKFLLKTAK